MSVPLLNAVYAMKPGRLTNLQRSVLARLAWAADDYGHNVWVGLSTISASTDASKRAVQNALAQLQADGWIATEKPSAGRGRTVHRCLNVEKIQPGYLKALKGAPAAPFARAETEKGAFDDTNGGQKVASGARIDKPELIDKPERSNTAKVLKEPLVASMGSASTASESLRSTSAAAQDYSPQAQQDWRVALAEYRAQTRGWHPEISRAIARQHQRL